MSRPPSRASPCAYGRRACILSPSIRIQSRPWCFWRRRKTWCAISGESEGEQRGRRGEKKDATLNYFLFSNAWEQFARSLPPVLSAEECISPQPSSAQLPSSLPNKVKLRKGAEE